jgi:hypothetical protein
LSDPGGIRRPATTAPQPDIFTTSIQGLVRNLDLPQTRKMEGKSKHEKQS